MISTKVKVSSLKGTYVTDLCRSFNNVSKGPILTLSTISVLSSCGAIIDTISEEDITTDMHIYFDVCFDNRTVRLVCYTTDKTKLNRNWLHYDADAKKPNIFISQLNVPRLCNKDYVIAEASFEDYFSIDNKRNSKNMISEDYWDSLNVGKYICSYNTVPLCVILIVANATTIESNPTLVTSVIHHRVDTTKDPKLIAESIKEAAREIYDTKYVRFIADNNICKTYEADDNIGARASLNAPIWFTV